MAHKAQVGERMFISRETVRTHLGHVFGTLGVNGRVELAACVVRHNEACRAAQGSRVEPVRQLGPATVRCVST
jgi:hypothetical protein